MTSAHVVLMSTVGGQSVFNMEGDETMSDGNVTAMRLTENVAETDLTMVLVDGALYMKLPPELDKSGKPWVKPTVGSANPLLRKLAALMGSAQQSASLNQYGAFVEATNSLRTVAVEQLDGATVTHYSLLVDVGKVHSAAITEAMKTSLAQAGLTKIPVDIWVDAMGRSVKAAERFKVQGETVSLDMRTTRINQPLKIVAPPAGQVLADSQVPTT
jgi:hypothetical protein